MSASHLYYPEHLVSKAEKYQNINQHITLELGCEHFPLMTPAELRLAAFVVASYHNQYVCNNALEYEDLDWVSDIDEEPTTV